MKKLSRLYSKDSISMNNFHEKYNFTTQEWESCLKVLNELKDNPLNNPNNKVFGALITKVHKLAKKELKNKTVDIKEKVNDQKPKDIIKKNQRQIHQEFNHTLVKKSQIVHNALSKVALFEHNTQQKVSFSELKNSKKCYCCGVTYKRIHSFYHKLCPHSATINYGYRALEINLTGRNVILTGGRVKVGYATALKFLRSGANLMLTTRFPALSLKHFEQEKDYNEWNDRLTLYGLDLRNLSAVEAFLEFYKSKYHTLDILVNNATQTIKYLSKYYKTLIQDEQKLLLTYPKSSQLIANNTPLSNKIQALDYMNKNLEPTPLNRFGQPIDFREKNSWNSKLEEVSTHELLEVNLINHISPYMLIKELTPLFKASTFRDKFIINVSSSEGQFSYTNKTIHHPHTNMTKAALNMMTRTSASSYAKDEIYMNSVDVGWISTGAVESKREKLFEKGFVPPLDSVDGCARIFHPIYKALLNKEYTFGKLLKNFNVVDW